MPRYTFWRSLLSAWFFALVGVSAAVAQPHLVTDLNQGRVSANLQPLPSRGIEQDGVVYFPGQDPQHGYELWRSDGTAEGTYRLVDLCPGSCWGGGEGIGFFNGFLYFLGNDREHGTEIWRTDGTVGGEELLGDFCPGDCGTELNGWVVRDGAIWFLTQGFGQTPILWTSDGTPGGTRPFANLCTDLGICGFVDYSGAFLVPNPSGPGFVLWVSTDALSLYRTDGTAAGTELLHRFTTSFLAPQVAKNGGKGELEGLKAAIGAGVRTAAEEAEPLFFLDGFDLWTSDGTSAGTRFVRNVEAMTDFNHYVESVRVIDGIWYAIFDYGAWLRSDGTADGTFRLAKVDPQFRPTLGRIGDAVFAVTVQGVWRAGATPETTVRFDGPVGDVLTVIERPGRLYVLSYERGGFVWSTDGTAAGTRRHHLDGPPNPDQYEMGGFGAGVMISRGYRELWRIDQAGAERLHDFQPENGGSGPVDQIVLGRRLLFVSLPGLPGAKLFSTDGTAAGTTAISPYVDGYFGFEFQPQVYRLTRAGDRAFFTTYGRVWTSDGTAAGTQNFRPAYSSSTHVLTAPIGVVGDRFVFGANFKQYPLRCEPGDTEPWVSDGTQRGTKQILDLNPFLQPGSGSQCETVAVSSSPGPGVSFGSFALFAADDLLHGRELFATDGTKEGTLLVADLNPKLMPNTITDPTSPPHAPDLIGVGSDPSDLVRAGNRAFFVADDGTTGRELWVTNGRRRGTRRVADLVAGPGSSTPHELVAVGEGIYFFAADGDGEGLYKSDGTRRGTVLVSDLAGLSQARELTVAQGKVFFVAFRPAAGTELWTSLGTPGTTREVLDLRPGSRGSLPQNLKAVGARVVFAAEDGTSGLEPWSSDGTAAGTVRWADIAPGAASSSPGPFSLANGQLLFGADDGEHGRELWAIPVAGLAH